MESGSLQRQEFNSGKPLGPLWFGLRIMGLRPPEKNKVWYYCYAVAINLIVTVWYSMSMFLYIFNFEGKRALISNLSQLSGSMIVSLKIINTYLKREKLFELRKLIAKLDTHVVNADERVYFQYVFKVARRFFMVFAISCALAGAVCDLPAIFSNERRLIFPAFFPWNWRKSAFTYHAANTYQVLGLYVQIYQDVICDTYPATLLWLLKGHLRVLGLRVKKIGWNAEKSPEQNYEQLVKCVKDHQTCFEFFKLCQNINSRIMLLQFISTQIILCATALYLIFFIDDVYKCTYLLAYFACMVQEITFCCFCGTELMEESVAFTEALYSCNWMDQSAKFKQILIIFMENTQSPWTNYAGGIISVSLSTWVTVLKSAYSLFAVFGRTV